VLAFTGGNMLNAKALKYGILASLIVLASFTGVMYALAYTVKSEVIYTTETLRSMDKNNCSSQSTCLRQQQCLK